MSAKPDAVTERLQAVDIPVVSAIVIGSGILDVLDIRVSSDLDIVVTPTVLEQLENDVRFKKDVRDSGTRFEGPDMIEVWGGWTEPGTNTVRDFDALLADSSVIGGVRYMNLAYVRAWKAAKGREKDVKDIRLIDEYTKKHGS